MGNVETGDVGTLFLTFWFDSLCTPWTLQDFTEKGMKREFVSGLGKRNHPRPKSYVDEVTHSLFYHTEDGGPYPCTEETNKSDHVQLSLHQVGIPIQTTDDRAQTTNYRLLYSVLRINSRYLDDRVKSLPEREQPHNRLRGAGFASSVHTASSRTGTPYTYSVPTRKN